MFLAYALLALSFCFSASGALECVCANGFHHIWSGPDTNASVIGIAHTGDCLQLAGNMTFTDQQRWANVRYQSQNAWITRDSLSFRNCSESEISNDSKIQLPGCPRIVTRQEWKAMRPSQNMPLLDATPKYAFIHHGATGACHTQAECASIVRNYQQYHMTAPPTGHGWWDIGYSFVVGEDGNVYEGRGWDEIGAHTKGYNGVGLGICIIGDFRTRLPNDAALSAVKQLIQCGVDNGRILTNYTLRGHRDMGSTECPGQSLYDLIQTWPHYWKN